MATEKPPAPPEGRAQDAAKAAAGLAAAALVESGMKVGLGTGSTAAFAIAELGRRIREEDLHIVGTPTSFAAEFLARTHRVPLLSLDDLDTLDLAFDGADEVNPALDLIKGRGAAHTRERVVASIADRFVVLADASKLVSRLGTRMPVPVEFLPMALRPVSRALTALGGRPELRMAQRKDGPIVTDQGFWILDVWFDGIDEPGTLGSAIRAIPGVLDHGLFFHLATDVLVGEEAGGFRHLKRPGPA